MMPSNVLSKLQMSGVRDIRKYDNCIISGGRRATGGILGFGRSPAISDLVKVILEDPDSNFCLVKIQQIYLAIGYFPPRKSFDQKLLDFMSLVKKTIIDRGCQLVEDTLVTPEEVIVKGEFLTWSYPMISNPLSLQYTKTRS